MILTIDIGNTTTNFGLFEGAKLKSQFSVGTQTGRTPDELTLQLKALARTKRLHLTKAKQILVCSVVPRMTSVLTESLRSLRAVPLRIVGQDLTVPLVNKYRYPEQVGQDRLVGAYAAWHTYQQDCIVADFGTAITIDIVTKQREYLGGIIAPGVDISLEALAARTALLPKVDLREPPELLGRDTANSIRSGVFNGCIALVDGLVTRLKKEYAPHAKVVATGGASPLIAKHATTIDALRPHLVLEGLLYLASSKTA
jgi:type III pantothenate kinase